MADELTDSTALSPTHVASPAADAELATQLRAGDFTAFTTVYDLLAAPAYALAYRLIGDAGLAEDVVQEVLLSLWEHPQRYDPMRGTLRTWVLSAVHHRAVDRIRRRATSPQTSLDAPRGLASGGSRSSGQHVTEGLTLAEVLRGTSDDEPAEQAERDERAHSVRRALSGLPAAQCEVLLLTYYGGLTQQQVATHLQQPLGTVKTRVRLALVKLRSLLIDFDEREAQTHDIVSPHQQLQREGGGGYPGDNG